jgi:hypothetical protein
MTSMGRAGFVAPKWKWLFAIAACWLFAGCHGRVATVPVSGRVRLGGEPLAGATVIFQPVADPESTTAPASGSAGKTDADGRYTLRLIAPDQPGAVPGKHTVTITTAVAGSDDSVLPSGERVPEAWRNGSQTFVVPADGTSAADFEL